MDETTRQMNRMLFYHFDWVMFGAIALVAVLGLANLYSAGFAGGDASLSNFYKQLAYFLVGFGCLVALHSFDYRELHTYGYPLYGLVLLLLIWAVVAGSSGGGAQRWINLGFFRLQPSEPAKLVVLITLASYYSRKDTGKGFSLKELFMPAVITGLPFVLIVVQPDLGTALLLVFLFASMTLFVKLKWSTLATLSGFVAAIVPLAWKYGLHDYQRRRIETFLNPEADSMGSGYHITQSKIAVGSGGMFGKGYLKGTQGHLHFLPERHTDFAFSVWAEEWGFAGALFFLAAFFFMILWGLNVALSSRDKFGVLLAFGVVSLLFWQAVINLLMVMGFLPVVGIPLPLFSYGGSSLLTNLLGLGILMNVRMRRFQKTA